MAWDGLSGDRLAADITERDEGMSVALDLGRRESLVIAVDPSQPHSDAGPEIAGEDERTPIAVDWSLTGADGHAVSIDSIGDWSQKEGWELFSGTITYRAAIEFPAADEFLLELGAVGDIAEVLIDGQSVGTRMWAPYDVHLGCVSPGRRTVEIRVTNSMANAYEGLQMPSGLMGPVTLVARRQ